MQLDATLGGLAGAAASSEALVEAAFIVSAMAGTNAVLLLTADAALVLCLLRQWRGALTVVAAVLSTQVVVHLIKVSVERPRPAGNTELAHAAGFSFPSAHSASSTALYATLAFLAARSVRGPARVAIAAAGATFVAAVGLSRILLAAHYPVDVLAGWLTGGALVAASWLVLDGLLSRGVAAPTGPGLGPGARRG